MTERAVDIPIISVTLLEDRAQVTRKATLELLAGVSRLAVEGVSPILADKTLVGRTGGEAARVVDARVVRKKAVLAAPPSEFSEDEPEEGARDDDSREDGARPDSVESLRHLHDDMFEQLRTLQAQQRAAKEQSALLDQLSALTLDELSVDAAWGRSPAPEAGSELAELDKRRAAARDEIVAGARRISEMEGRLQRLSHRIGVLSTPSTEMSATLQLDVLVEQPGRIEIAVDYVVPGACWRPHHTAELLAGGEELRFSTDASIWQNTGEDWPEVELAFSTERLSLGAEPPELYTDQLRVKRKSSVLRVEARDQTVQEASKGAAGVGELPGIDDGGEVQLLRALTRSTVPSDGRPHRVTLGTFTAGCSERRVCYPELVRSVLVETTQANGSERPILAGPVDLIRDSGLCGRTTVLFIAPRERFALGWGPDAELRVQRDEQIKQDEAGLLSAWTRLLHLVELRLSNLGPHERVVTISERVPVSEIEKVKITADKKRTTGGKEPDKDGFVEWQLTLKPHATEDVALRYTLEKHSDVVGV